MSVPALRYGLLVVALLFAALPFCSSALSKRGLAGRMHDISQDLDRQLYDVMARHEVRYSSVNTSALPYNATTRFNPIGMRQLYNATTIFVNFVQGKQAFPEGELSFFFFFAGGGFAGRGGGGVS